MKNIFKQIFNKTNLRKFIGVFLFFFMPIYILLFILNNYKFISPSYFFTNISFILVFQSIIYILFRNTKTSIWLTSIIVYTFNIINEIVFNLRGSPIIPNDFYSLSTALKVFGNYNITVTQNMITSSIALIILLILSHIFTIKKSKKLFLTSILSIAIGISIILTIPTTAQNDFDTTMSNKDYGILQTLYLNCLKMHTTPPESYSDAFAISVLNQYETTDILNANKPNIIVIMDEAFSDMTIHEEYRDALEFMPFINSLSNNTIKGNLLVPVLGGNTCNTEFEFLTGQTLALTPNAIPYQQYIVKDCDSLASQLKALNYKTIAIHPYWKQCWQREKVYPLLGFDEFIDANKFDTTSNFNVNRSLDYDNMFDFGNLKYIRNYISDEESFNQIIKQYENHNSEEPLFIFNVTMQNHGPYDYTGSDFVSKTYIANTNDARINQYLTLINESDKAFNKLIDYFSNVTEPTIILFFGDHQPSLLESDISSIEALQESYTLPFVLWANYDIEEKTVPLTSSNYLSLILLETSNLPLSEYDLFRQDLQKTYKAINPYGALTSDNQWIPVAKLDTEIKEKINILQYYMLFEK